VSRAAPGAARSTKLSVPSAALAFSTAAVASLLTGCGGGAPLLHPVHPLQPGEVMVGAGLSGQLALKPLPQVSAATAPNQAELQDLAVAPGVAPWVAGRVGIPGSNEGGLTYTGHALRLDIRHAFLIGQNAALSVGLGGSAIIARRPGDGDADGVYGGGADLPVLIGFHTSSNIFACWFGPRGGFDILEGGVQLDENSLPLQVSARHYYGALVAGIRVGFRHVHLALEIDAAYHHADGTFQASTVPGMPVTPAAPTSSDVQQFSVTPAGSLEVTF